MNASGMSVFWGLVAALFVVTASMPQDSTGEAAGAALDDAIASNANPGVCAAAEGAISPAALCICDGTCQ